MSCVDKKDVASLRCNKAVELIPFLFAFHSLGNLMLQAKRQGSLEFEIPYDRQELADYLQVERSGLSAEIGKLRRQGTIEAERRRFKICRPLDPRDSKSERQGEAAGETGSQLLLINCF